MDSSSAAICSIVVGTVRSRKFEHTNGIPEDRLEGISAILPHARPVMTQPLEGC
jgi:hypothetical protein